MEQSKLEFETPLNEVDLKRQEILGPEWFKVLRNVLNSPTVRKVSSFVGQRRLGFGITVYPAREDVFRAFKLTPYDKVKVVILGQNPYHNGSADGLAFSCRSAIVPESLARIYEAIEESEHQLSSIADLTEWATQGVLLLNTSLTVEEGNAESHLNEGWEELTSTAIRALSNLTTPVCYLLWGKHAREYKRYIVNPNQLVIEAEHPIAGAHNGGRKWVYNNCFTKCNEFLEKHGESRIKWDSVNGDLPF